MMTGVTMSKDSEWLEREIYKLISDCAVSSSDAIDMLFDLIEYVYSKSLNYDLNKIVKRIKSMQAYGSAVRLSLDCKQLVEDDAQVLVDKKVDAICKHIEVVFKHLGEKSDVLDQIYTFSVLIESLASLMDSNDAITAIFQALQHFLCSYDVFTSENPVDYNELKRKMNSVFDFCSDLPAEGIEV